ncbi:helix-turn-helix domain-containing protein [Nocardia niwae]|uniref:helix-turn-helix domain-containing protein n=1 Tax=Nocardia niwae TaxID=626084 RepID=UPI0007A43D4B|nr:helix-turn-helix domain-containing protein [Nocardia niwae]
MTDHNRRIHAAGGAADRDERIRGLRDLGATYQQIARQLRIPARKVETVLGEATALHESGYTVREICERIGLPRASAHRLITDRSGAAVLSARTTVAVTGLVDMYGMQTDVLGWFLDLPRTTVYNLVGQMRKDRLVQPKLIEVQAGAKWVVPTGETAATYLGWVPRAVWKPTNNHCEHYRAVAQARIMLNGADLTNWISERRLRHEAEMERRQSRSRTATVGHIHDGRFLGVVDGTYGWWAVEVELTAKSAANMDKALRGAIWAARDAQPGPMTGVLYLFRGREVENTVMAAAERLPAAFNDLDMHLVIRDFDREWNRFLTHRKALRAAKTAPGAIVPASSKDLP